MVNTSRRKAVRFATKIPEDVYPAQEKMSLYSPSLFALWKTLESAEGGAWAFLSTFSAPRVSLSHLLFAVCLKAPSKQSEIPALKESTAQIRRSLDSPLKGRFLPPWEQPSNTGPLYGEGKR